MTCVDARLDIGRQGDRIADGDRFTGAGPADAVGGVKAMQVKRHGEGHADAACVVHRHGHGKFRPRNKHDVRHADLQRRRWNFEGALDLAVQLGVDPGADGHRVSPAGRGVVAGQRCGQHLGCARVEAEGNLGQIEARLSTQRAVEPGRDRDWSG